MRVTCVVAIACMAAAGCRDAPPAPATRPVEDAPPAGPPESPTTTATAPATRPATSQARPKPPKWISSVQPDDPDADVRIDARRAGDAEVVIHTQGIAAFVIDLAGIEPPVRRPVILRIDDQPIEVFGRRTPRRLYTRSPAGEWSGEPVK